MGSEPQDWEEIEKLSNTSSDRDGRLGLVKALHNVTTEIVNSKESINGLTPFIARIGIFAEKLNETLQKSDKSSTELTEALNKITSYGVWIAGAGVIVGILNLLLEIYKTFCIQ